MEYPFNFYGQPLNQGNNQPFQGNQQLFNQGGNQPFFNQPPPNQGYGQPSFGQPPFGQPDQSWTQRGGSTNHRILRYVINNHLIGKFQGQISYNVVNRINNIFQKYGLQSRIVSNMPGGWFFDLRRRDNIPDALVIEVIDTLLNIRPESVTLAAVGTINQQLIQIGSNLQVVPRGASFKTVKIVS